MGVSNPPYVPKFGAGAPAMAAPDGTIYYDTTASYAPYIRKTGAWHLAGAGGGGFVADVQAIITSNLAPTLLTLSTTVLASVINITTDGTGLPQEIQLQDFAKVNGEAQNQNGYLVSICCVNEANGADEPFITLNGGSGPLIKVLDNQGHVIAKGVNPSVTVANPDSVLIDYNGACAIFIWWDYGWYWINPNFNTDNTQTRLVVYITNPATAADFIIGSSAGNDATASGPSPNDGNTYALLSDGVSLFWQVFNATTPVAVAALPAAPVAGQRAMVNDALLPVFGAAVAAGGAVIVPVYFNGVGWRVG